MLEIDIKHILTLKLEFVEGTCSPCAPHYDPYPLWTREHGLSPPHSYHLEARDELHFSPQMTDISQCKYIITQVHKQECIYW